MEKKRKFVFGLLFLAALICPQIAVPIIEASGVSALAQEVLRGGGE